MSKIREPDIIFKWSNCCRLCLSQESTIDLFSEASIAQHFPSKIRTCLNFLIYSGDPMPRKICAACCMKLDNWCQFHKECIQTEKDLRRRLEPYKRIAFVKEYFDKYMKYEKSSQDGSISLESMSEYEEDEMEDEDVDEDDEDDMEIYSDSMQREDENSRLSDSEKVMSDHSRSDQRQNCSNTISKLRESGTELYANNGAGKEMSNFQRTNKIKPQDKGTNGSAKKSHSTNNTKDNEGAETIARTIDNRELNASFNKPKDECSGASKDSKESDSVIQSPKTCPECGVDFPSEEHFSLHSCIVPESGAESDDNDNLINPLIFVDTSLSEPMAKESSDGDGGVSDFTPESINKNEIDVQKKKIQATPWKCLVCGDYFKSVSDLKDHYDSTSNDCAKTNTITDCEVCKRKFPSKNELAEHQVIHTDTNVNSKPSDLVKCSRCDLQFPSENLLKEHLISHKGDSGEDVEGDCFCSKCDQIFYDKEQFEKHELIHNQQEIYNSIVTPQFTTFEGLERMDDLESENGEKKPQNVVRCFRCGRIFNTAEELEQHEFLKHKNPTPYFCRKCDLRFSARSQLLMHVRSHMRKSSSSNPGSNTSDNTCTICGAKFFLPSDLQSHLKMHKYSPTEEQIPPKSWNYQDSYEDNKIDLFARFKCSVCSKIFVHSGSIIRHGKNLHKGQAVHPLRLKRPIFLMKRARSLTMPTGKNPPKQPTNPNSQQMEEDQEPEPKWDQDSEGVKSDPSLEFGTEKCPFCEKVFKPTYLPRHIKRNHRGEVLDPQMLGRDIPDDSLVCRYCLKSCSNPHNRRVHESIHYPVKMQSTQCKICGQKFFNKSSYEVHILSCKSVRCGKCNKIFFRYLSLKNHSCIVTTPGEGKA